MHLDETAYAKVRTFGNRRPVVARVDEDLWSIVQFGGQQADGDQQHPQSKTGPALLLPRQDALRRIHSGGSTTGGYIRITREQSSGRGTNRFSKPTPTETATGPRLQARTLRTQDENRSAYLRMCLKQDRTYGHKNRPCCCSEKPKKSAE